MQRSTDLVFGLSPLGLGLWSWVWFVRCDHFVVTINEEPKIKDLRPETKDPIFFIDYSTTLVVG